MGSKIGVAVLVLGASQFHQWSRLSSGPVFAPEFPRKVVVLFNWAFGGIVKLAVMQLILDLVSLTSMAVERLAAAA